MATAIATKYYVVLIRLLIFDNSDDISVFSDEFDLQYKYNAKLDFYFVSIK